MSGERCALTTGNLILRDVPRSSMFWITDSSNITLAVDRGRKQCVH